MRNMLNLLLLPCLVIITTANKELVEAAVNYDYSFTRECLEEPLESQYNGGIAENASSLSQMFNLQKNMFYTISAWFRVSGNESADVAAVFLTENGRHYAGWSVARSGCWSMLKGGLNVKASGPAELYFESRPSTELWVARISLQPFTQEEWASHQVQSVEKVRKSNVEIRAVDQNGAPLVNASVNILSRTVDFPLGNSVSNRILTIPAYQDWFANRFRYAVFENEMKWQWNEPNRGQEDYQAADSMLRFAQQHGIKTRGHNVVWENDFWLPEWAKKLGPAEFSAATTQRQNSIMGRYAGEFIHWDVVNENLHFKYLDKMLGETASSGFYERGNAIDGEAVLFLNDYNTIENETDPVSSPARYLEKIAEIRSQGYGGPLGIGLQGHFYAPPNPPFIRAALDQLATAELPIWVSELDVDSKWPEAANYLEQIMRELHAHPAVEGIMIWAPWSPPDCYRMCITDGDFKNLPTGDVVDKLLSEWSHAGGFSGTTDSDGYFRGSLFHGEYELRFGHLANSSQIFRFNVTALPPSSSGNFQFTIDSSNKQ